MYASIHRNYVKKKHIPTYLLFPFVYVTSFIYILSAPCIPAHVFGALQTSSEGNCQL